MAVGGASKLWVYDGDALATSKWDITPVGLTAGIHDGAGGVPPDTWSLDTWGQYLVGCLTSDGKLYEWQLDTGTPAAVISNAPTGCQALAVTDERFIFALGAGGEARRVEWCDQGDNTTWTATATNQAGGYTLDGEGKILSARKGVGEMLIFTSSDLWRAQYIGQPYVYAFSRVGSNCPIIGPNAVAVVDGMAVWLGPDAFYVYDGGAVRTLNCDVDNSVFTQLVYSTADHHKCHAVPNKAHNEVWFFYPIYDGDEPTYYVIWNYKDNHWSLGRFSDVSTGGRSAALDRGVLGNIVMVDSTSTQITPYTHSMLNSGVGVWATPTQPYIRTWPIGLPDARRMRLKWIYQDWNPKDRMQVRIWDASEGGDDLVGTLTTINGVDGAERLPVNETARMFMLEFRHTGVAGAVELGGHIRIEVEPLGMR